MEDISVGNVVEGVVTGIENYGIFVKLSDDYYGLIHISQIINGFVKNPNEYATLGEKIFVEILEVDEDEKKCILSIKDINYRKSSDEKIVESIRGFSPLKHHLPIWIEEKMTELHKEENVE
mgnify:CR=1 FL=1